MPKTVLMSSATLAAMLAFTPAATALDCANAASDTEKIICTDPAAKAANDAMNAAYEALLTLMQGEQAEMLKTSQATWLSVREQNCGWQEDAAEKTACLVEFTGRRTAYLEVRPESGPGLGEGARLVPFLFSRLYTRPVCSADNALYRFADPAGGPGEAAFNGWMDELAADLEQDFGRFEEDDLPEDLSCEYTTSASLSYASPTLISANVSIYVYAGGAHGMSMVKSVVLDRAGGRLLTFGDAFPSEAINALAATCTEGIKAEKIKRFSEVGMEGDVEQTVAEDLAANAGTIAEGVGDFANWQIYEDRAEVYFPPYALGAYAEGDYQCALPKADLQKAAGEKGWLVP